MTSTADRLRLYEHAKEAWGDEPARTLMELLPADPSQLATTTDLTLLRSELREEMAELREEVATFRGEMRAELHQALAEQTRTLVLGSVGAIMTATALSFAASHLV